MAQLIRDSRVYMHTPRRIATASNGCGGCLSVSLLSLGGSRPHRLSKVRLGRKVFWHPRPNGAGPNKRPAINSQLFVESLREANKKILFCRFCPCWPASGIYLSTWPLAVRSRATAAIHRALRAHLFFMGGADVCEAPTTFGSTRLHA